MNITGVSVQLVGSGSPMLRAYCDVQFDGELVVRDVKVIESRGRLIVSMPSRKLKSPCPACGGANHRQAAFCNYCAARLSQLPPDGGRLHVDVCHPTTRGMRARLEAAVLAAYQEARAGQAVAS